MKYRVKIEDQTYEVEVNDVHSRPIVAMIDGERFEVWPQEEIRTAGGKAADQAAPVSVKPKEVTAPSLQTAGPAGSVVRAPIPGTIINIAVAPGDKIAVGQELLTLEAMKMKNVIRSPRAGEIASVRVNTGQTVKHHDVLLEFAE